MNEVQLLKIITGKLEISLEKHRNLYRRIVALMWKNGLPGATVSRAEEGIDEYGQFQSLYMEEEGIIGDTPILIETIAKNEQIQALIPKIKHLSPHAQIQVTDGFLPIQEEYTMEKDQFYLMKIYVKEESNILKLPAYEKILAALRDKGLIWSVLMKGIEGFGEDHVIHKQSLFSFSNHTPVIIESVGKGEVIEELLPSLKQLVTDGLIFVTPVQVELNR